MAYNLKRGKLVRRDGTETRLTSGAMKMLDQQRERFRAKFGRYPGPGDPVFFDETSDVPREISREAIIGAHEQTLIAMRSTRIPAHLIYAYAKTGLVVNDKGYKNMTRDDRREYDAAIDEYTKLEESGKVTEQQIWDGSFVIEPNPGIHD